MTHYLAAILRAVITQDSRMLSLLLGMEHFFIVVILVVAIVFKNRMESLLGLLGLDLLHLIISKPL